MHNKDHSLLEKHKLLKKYKNNISKLEEFNSSDCLLQCNSVREYKFVDYIGEWNESLDNFIKERLKLLNTLIEARISLIEHQLMFDKMLKEFLKSESDYTFMDDGTIDTGIKRLTGDKYE